MDDPRVNAVIAAVESQFPGTRVKIAMDPFPLSIRVPNFTILLDAGPERRREVEDFALDLTFKTFPGEPVPYFVVCVTPETEARYQREVADALAEEATSKG